MSKKRPNKKKTVTKSCKKSCSKKCSKTPCVKPVLENKIDESQKYEAPINEPGYFTRLYRYFFPVR